MHGVGVTQVAAVGLFAAMAVGQAALVGRKPIIGKKGGAALVGMYVIGVGGYVIWYFAFKAFR